MAGPLQVRSYDPKCTVPHANEEGPGSDGETQKGATGFSAIAGVRSANSRHPGREKQSGEEGRERSEKLRAAVPAAARGDQWIVTDDVEGRRVANYRSSATNGI